MPRTNIKYDNTIIYKIVCNNTSIKDNYVGHTTDFTRRKNQHKYACNNPTNKTHHFKLYKVMRENGGFENWSIVEIEKYSCNDGNEARARERYWYDVLNASLNTTIPNRLKEEYYRDNLEQILVYQKIYNTTNRDYISERSKKYNEINKDKLSEYKKTNYELNRDKLLEKQRIYYQNNREKRIEYHRKYCERKKAEKLNV